MKKSAGILDIPDRNFDPYDKKMLEITLTMIVGYNRSLIELNRKKIRFSAESGTSIPLEGEIGKGRKERKTTTK